MLLAVSRFVPLQFVSLKRHVPTLTAEVPARRCVDFEELERNVCIVVPRPGDVDAIQSGEGTRHGRGRHATPHVRRALVLAVRLAGAVRVPARCRPVV